MYVKKVVLRLLKKKKVRNLLRRTLRVSLILLGIWFLIYFFYPSESQQSCKLKSTDVIRIVLTITCIDVPEDASKVYLKGKPSRITPEKHVTIFKVATWNIWNLMFHFPVRKHRIAEVVKL